MKGLPWHLLHGAGSYATQHVSKFSQRGGGNHDVPDIQGAAHRRIGHPRRHAGNRAVMQLAECILTTRECGHPLKLQILTKQWVVAVVDS
jgi:hypothetical protein